MNLKKERLQKWLAKTGHMSRRAAEKHIQEGRIQLNGKTVTTMGILVDPTQDQVAFDGRLLQLKEVFTWIALYKPKNYITTKQDPQGRPTVMNLIKKYPHLHPVGRLDFESEGLLLLTNEGAFTYVLTHPKFEVLKKYEVTIRGTLPATSKKRLLQGIELPDGLGKFTALDVLKKEATRSVLRITVSEGRNRFIRKMLGFFDIEILKLKRTQMGPILLNNLKPKEYRVLSEKEILSIKSLAQKKL